MDSDRSLSSINSFQQGAGAGSYTARAGETLQSVASNLWGDASLWYKIADANGLSRSARLNEGQVLRLPASVMKNTHNASTYQPYDPAEAIGDTSPTTPKPPKKNKCGAFGQVLLVVIAVAVAAVVAPWAIGSGGTAAAAATATTAATAATGLTAAIGSTAATIVGGAVAGATGSIVSQGVGVMTGIQEKFSWNAVAMAGIGGGIGAATNFAPFISGTGKMAAFARGAISSAATQGIGVALGFQKKFSWAAVAAAGVASGVSSSVASKLKIDLGDYSTAQNTAGNVAASSAAAIASAATRSAIEGSDFGDNLRAAIPDVIGSAIGNKLAYEFAIERRTSEFENMVKMRAERDPNAAPPVLSRKDIKSMIRNDGKLSSDAAVKLRDYAFGPVGQTVFDNVMKAPRNSNGTKEEEASALGMAYLAEWSAAIDKDQGAYVAKHGAEQWKDLRAAVTGLILSTDVYFDNSIEGFLPEGFKRMSESELGELDIKSD